MLVPTSINVSHELSILLSHPNSLSTSEKNHIGFGQNRTYKSDHIRWARSCLGNLTDPVQNWINQVLTDPIEMQN